MKFVQSRNIVALTYLLCPAILSRIYYTLQYLVQRLKIELLLRNQIDLYIRQNNCIPNLLVEFCKPAVVIHDLDNVYNRECVTLIFQPNALMSRQRRS